MLISFRKAQLVSALSGSGVVMASTALAPPRSLLNSLSRLRCSIFQTAYNPTSARTGAKYLRARLRGPSLASYYPPREEMSISALNRAYPGLNLVDVDEVKRLISIEEHKARGKGAPKKAKTKGACCDDLGWRRLTDMIFLMFF